MGLQGKLMTLSRRWGGDGEMRVLRGEEGSSSIRMKAGIEGWTPYGKQIEGLSVKNLT